MAKAKESAAFMSAAERGYESLKGRDKDGKAVTSAGNGDAVHRAMFLHKINGGSLEQIVKTNKLDLKGADEYPNRGGFAMAIGASLRKKISMGETVKIGSVDVKSLKTVVALPKFEAATAPAKAAPKKAASKKTVKAKAPRKPRAKKDAETTAYDAP